MTLPISTACTLAALLAAALPAAATPVTALPADIDARVITFSGYSSFDTPRVLPATVDVGTAEVSEQVDLSFGNGSVEHILGPVAASFGSNGSWPANGAYAGLGQISGTMTFTFSRNLNFVGGFVNYNPAIDGTTAITAYDEFDNEVGFSELTFNFNNAGGSGQGQFLGFANDVANIRSVVFTNASIAVDDLTFGTKRAGVPEPGTVALVLASLGALAWTRRRSVRR